MYLFINPLAAGVGEPVSLRTWYGEEASAVLQKVQDGAEHQLLLGHTWTGPGKSQEMSGYLYTLYFMLASLYAPFPLVLKQIAKIEIKVIRFFRSTAGLMISKV